MASGSISRGDSVVLFDTGAGFKSEAPPLSKPAPVPNDETYWREKVVPSLRGAA